MTDKTNVLRRTCNEFFRSIGFQRTRAGCILVERNLSYSWRLHQGTGSDVEISHVGTDRLANHYLNRHETTRLQLHSLRMTPQGTKPKPLGLLMSSRLNDGSAVAVSSGSPWRTICHKSRALKRTNLCWPRVMERIVARRAHYDHSQRRQVSYCSSDHVQIVSIGLIYGDDEVSIPCTEVHQVSACSRLPTLC